EREAVDVEKRIKLLLAAIESGGDALTLVGRLRELKDRQKQIVGEFAALRPVPRLPQSVVESRLAEWRGLLRKSPTQGRAVIKRVVKGRIIFTPAALGITGRVVDGTLEKTEPYGYTFEAQTRFDKLFSGVACQHMGARDQWWNKAAYPADIRQQYEDYGRLLERAERRLT